MPNTQDELSKTRVQITVPLENPDGIEEVELPFVVGVLSDLPGDSEKPLPEMAQREFTDVTEDNLDQFIRSLEVALNLDLPDYLTGSDKVERLRLELASMGAFRPEELVKQGPMKRFKEIRDRLERLHAGLGGNAGESELSQVLDEIKGELKGLLDKAPPTAS